MSSSIKNKFIVVIIVACGFALGYFMQGSNTSRIPASNKLAAPQLPRPWAHSIQGKHHRFADLSISPVEGIADRDDQEMKLRARIRLLAPINGDLDYTWTLPAGVSLVEGELSDALSGLQPGQEHTVDLTIVGFSKESTDRTILFRVDAIGMGGLRTSGAVSIATENLRPPKDTHALSAGMASGEFLKAQSEDPEKHRFMKRFRSGSAQ